MIGQDTARPQQPAFGAACFDDHVPDQLHPVRPDFPPPFPVDEHHVQDVPEDAVGSLPALRQINGGVRYLCLSSVLRRGQPGGGISIGAGSEWQWGNSTGASPAGSCILDYFKCRPASPAGYRILDCYQSGPDAAVAVPEQVSADRECIPAAAAPGCRVKII